MATYTRTSLTTSEAVGIRGERKSVVAIRTATESTTVVKKLTTFCRRVSELNMMDGEESLRERGGEVRRVDWGERA